LLTRISAGIDRYSLMLVGMVVIASIAPARGAGAAFVDGLAAAAIALLFFLHGAKLSREAIAAGAGHWRLHVVVLAFTFLLFPLLGLAAQALALPFLTPSLAAGLLYLALLPSTVQSSIAFTSIAGGNVPAAICAASLSNLLGIMLTPMLVALLMGGSGGGISMEAARAILFELLLPFIAGHAMRPWLGAPLARMGRLVGWVDRGSILLIVYAAFSGAVVAGLWRTVPAGEVLLVTLISIVMFWIMLLATRVTARRLGFSTADETVILFCGSKKSLASGVPIAGALFPASQIGAIILPLMIFHQIQLLVCAVIAQHYARRRRQAADAVGPGG
jgi:sodium/bile acid cotransporter 7